MNSIPETMRAAVWEGSDQHLTVQDIPVPKPQAGEALVRITACGVCHTDLHVLKGEVAFPPPGVIGHEISGEIVALGPDTEGPGLIPGTPVVGAFIMPCGECSYCREGRDDLCEVFFRENRGRGNLLDGSSRLATASGRRLSMYSMAGMAEYAVVPVTALAPRPPEVPPEEAAILGCAAFTAFGAVRKSGLKKGESVAVVAVGGIGSSLIQVARHQGAGTIIAVDVAQEKLDSARRLGADVVINSRLTEDVADEVRQLTGQDGVDVVFEALGRPETFSQAASLLGTGGRMVAVGIAAGRSMADVEITPLVRRGQTIMGSFGAVTRVDLPAVTQLAAEGGYRLRDTVTRKYSLEDADEAYQALDRGEITGRAIVVM